jgi:hypothetical protein
VLLVRETKHHVAAESKLAGELPPEGLPSQREVFWRTSLLDKNLSSVSQAGLVNNLNDGMAWGLFPLFFAAAGCRSADRHARRDLPRGVGARAALHRRLVRPHRPQVAHRLGHVGAGAGIGVIALSEGFAGFALGAVLLGSGTAMVYPTLLAAIGDVAHPDVARVVGRRVPPVARPGLRRGSAPRRRGGGRLRARRGGMGHRGTDVRLGRPRRDSHARDARSRSEERPGQGLEHLH